MRDDLATRRRARDKQTNTLRRLKRNADAKRDPHERWANQELVPQRITLALDLRGLYGPEVDAACGAAEPDVDEWETGEMYPSWEQFQALCGLTGFPASFFFLPADEQVSLLNSSLRFVMSPEEIEQEEQRRPVESFLPGAWDRMEARR